MRKIIQLLIIFGAIPTLLISQSNSIIIDNIVNGIYISDKTYIFTKDSIISTQNYHENFFIDTTKKLMRGVCDSVDHVGQDWIITHDTTIGGRHYNIGTFTINSGVTVTVAPNCHIFTIEAVNINIAGTINADGAGETGGNGGNGGAQAYGDDHGCNGG